MKERKIGEVFQFEDVQLKVEKSNTFFKCKDCFFYRYREPCYLIYTGNCTEIGRSDGTSVKFVEVGKMKVEIEDKILSAIRNYDKYRSYCQMIAAEAQKYIDWTYNVNCEYYPSDGLCLNIESDRVYVCPVDSFFYHVERYDSITENEFIKLCI